MKRYQYRTPTGSLIVGELDVVQGRAEISFFDENGDPEWEGGTEVFWDSQRAVEQDGKPLFLDDDGEEWTLDQCTLEEDTEDGR